MDIKKDFLKWFNSSEIRNIDHTTISRETFIDILTMAFNKGDANGTERLFNMLDKKIAEAEESRIAQDIDEFGM